MSARTPYLVFLGDALNDLEAKTGHGVAHWRPEICIAQLRYANCKADTGLPDMDIRQAVRAGAQSLLIGVAPTGGEIKPDWETTLVDALDSGLDIVSGLHTPLESIPRLANAAMRSGRTLVDVRTPPAELRIANGEPRSGKRLLTVGTDCCVGKKYTALALHRSLRQAGQDATFRATGQTGIIIAGTGIAIDAVVSDFVSGAAEMLSPDNHPGHWDIIEGQGSLFHPAYSAVTLGLIHGSQPDYLVLCHSAGRTHIDEYPGYAIPDLATAIEQYEQAARLTNPASRCIGLSIDTSEIPENGRHQYLETLEQTLGLPCFDPLLASPGALMELITPTLSA